MTRMDPAVKNKHYISMCTADPAPHGATLFLCVSRQQKHQQTVEHSDNCVLCCHLVSSKIYTAIRLKVHKL